MDGSFDWRRLRTTAVQSASRVGLGRDDAEDAAQEALLRAWRKRGQCRDTADAPSWVASIGRREALRLVARTTEVPLDPLTLPDSPVAPDPPDSRLDMRAAVAALPAVDRMVLLLRYEHDLAHAEIAQIMGSCEATSAIRLHRAHKRLRSVVKSTGAHDFKAG